MAGDAAIGCLRRVLCNESTSIEIDDALWTFVIDGVCAGDLRRALTLVQGVQAANLPMSVETLVELGGLLPDSLVEQVMHMLKHPATLPSPQSVLAGNASSDQQVFAWLLQHVVHAGHSVPQLLSQLLAKVGHLYYHLAYYNGD